MLRQWANLSGLILPSSLVPEKKGGYEHDVRFNPQDRRWYKFTKPYSAGITIDIVDQKPVVLPATPLQYLRRWQLCNRHFGDDAQFVGLSRFEGKSRLVVSQPHVAGDSPTWEEIDEFFTNFYPNWKVLATPPNTLWGDYHAKAYFYGRFGVFDVRPLNVVKLPSGKLYPIDIIPCLFNKIAANYLKTLVVA